MVAAPHVASGSTLSGSQTLPGCGRPYLGAAMFSSACIIGLSSSLTLGERFTSMIQTSPAALIATSTPKSSKHALVSGGRISGCAAPSITSIFSRIVGSCSSNPSQSFMRITRSRVTWDRRLRSRSSNGPSAATRYPPQKTYQCSAFVPGGDTHATYSRHPSLCPRASSAGSRTEGWITHVFPSPTRVASRTHASGVPRTTMPVAKFLSLSFANQTWSQKRALSSSPSVAGAGSPTHRPSLTNHVGTVRPRGMIRRARRALSSSQSVPGHEPACNEKLGWSA